MLVATAVAIVVVGCASPLTRTTDQELRDLLIASHRAHLAALSAPGSGEAQVVEVSREPSDVEAKLDEKRRAKLNEMSGPDAYRTVTIDPGKDLLGSGEVQTVRLNLQHAIELGVRHNIDLQVARMIPAIAQTQITQAEAVFDAVFFTNVDWQKLDTPQPAGVVPGLSGNIQSKEFFLTTGIRKALTTGGTITAQTTIDRNERAPSVLGVEEFYNADVMVTLTQPILRNFGSDVNRTNIILAENARRSELQQLRKNLIDIVAQIEQAYWDQVTATNVLLIQSRILGRTVTERDRLVQRAGFDASPVRITQANSFVELRRADVIRARQNVRSTSDTLKRLINAPDLPLGDETIVLAVEAPVEDPITFSLVDAVTTALRHRPEMQTALLRIKDASIRQRVADNLRLPLLDLTATLGLSGVDIDDAGGAYGDLGEGDFVDYLLRADFEQPIGKRQFEAFHEQRRLERRATVLAYQRQAQDVIRGVKTALRNIVTSYELIGATRAARLAAADNLRAIQAREDVGEALTPEFLLDLKLSTQERLANAEIQEVQALTGYNVSIAQLYGVMGTLLERNGIDFREAEE